MAVKFARLGNGTLTLGPVGTELDISAQVVGCTLSSSVDTGDTLTVLTGDTIGSGMTTEATLGGSIILDPETGGIGEYSWTHHGEVVAFTFTPSTSAGIIVAGTLTITRLDIGADQHGALLQPDFSWTASVPNDGVTWGTATP